MDKIVITKIKQINAKFIANNPKEIKKIHRHSRKHLQGI